MVTLAFEAAARDWKPGDLECDSRLMAMGEAYKRLLADRTLLLVQLQAYAALDPDVRTVVREEWGSSTAASWKRPARHARSSTSSSRRECS